MGRAAAGRRRARAAPAARPRTAGELHRTRPASRLGQPVRPGRANARRHVLGAFSLGAQDQVDPCQARHRPGDAKYPKAVAKLDKDWAHLTAFYDFPAEHWRHLKTSNAIESSFATVKLRTRVTKGAGSKKAALVMAYKLLDAAQERWRRFNGHELVADLLADAKFKDGNRVTDAETTTD